ncbi:MAG: TldD/PmbA family protein [Acidobacteriota bacterium]|nr:TldD/PmbA family protein [Acidobacteriota bacterium]
MRADLDKEYVKTWAQRAVDKAVAAGAHTVSAKVTHQAKFALEVRNDEVENLSEAQSRSLGLTISKDNRRATVSTCELSDDSLNTLVDQAVQMCRYTDQDPFYGLPDKEWLAGEQIPLHLADETVLTKPIDEKVAMVRELERILKSRAPDFVSDGASLKTSMLVSALANSHGFCDAQDGSTISLGISAFAEDNVSADDLNTGRRQMGSWFSRSRWFDDLETLDEIADAAIDNVRRKLGARKPRTGSFPVYFEPATARMLWSHLLSAITGTAVYRNQSYLIDRIGTEVCSPAIHLTDDPLLPRGLASRFYDNEGVACRKQDLVRDGVLQTYTLSTYSARKLGMKSTGHASGVCNLIVRPGELSEREMLAKMGTGVWVTSVLGQGANISTGDYSRGVLGLWVENGQPVYPIIECTLNSNLDNMFRNITMVGNNVYEKSSTITPGLVIGEMALSGN